MIERIISVQSDEGLHTRPANKLVKLVKQHQSAVTIAKSDGDKEAPGGNLLKIMKLGVVQGDSLRVRCDGPDEKELLTAIEGLLS